MIFSVSGRPLQGARTWQADRNPNPNPSPRAGPRAGRNLGANPRRHPQETKLKAEAVERAIASAPAIVVLRASRPGSRDRTIIGAGRLPARARRSSDGNHFRADRAA